MWNTIFIKLCNVSYVTTKVTTTRERQGRSPRPCKQAGASAVGVEEHKNEMAIPGHWPDFGLGMDGSAVNAEAGAEWVNSVDTTP
jgi:hypothetical protein